MMDKIVETIKNNMTTTPLILGVSGIPGSGKSSFSKELSINLLSLGIKSIILPLDGYHIRLKCLSKELLIKRGCFDSFDLQKFKNDLIKLLENKIGSFPSFDHSIKDPIEDDIIINLNNIDVLIIEGLYVFDNSLALSNLFTLKYFLISDIDKAMIRVGNRNFNAGIFNTLDESIERANLVDKDNAIYVLENSDLKGCDTINYIKN